MHFYYKIVHFQVKISVDLVFFKYARDIEESLCQGHSLSAQYNCIKIK